MTSLIRNISYLTDNHPGLFRQLQHFPQVIIFSVSFRCQQQPQSALAAELQVDIWTLYLVKVELIQSNIFARLTPHTSHLTPHTSHLTPLTYQFKKLYPARPGGGEVFILEL